MTITFYGENCFKLQSGELTVLIDPINSSSGLVAPRFKYDALIKTLSPFPPETEESSAVNIIGPGEYNFKEAKVLAKPFKKDETVQAKIVCKGRFPGEKLVVAKDRVISVFTDKIGTVRLKIKRTKHNIFTGQIV